MKVLIVGSGGREHAIAWKISQNTEVEKIYCAPGNGGTKSMAICENIDLNKIDELLNFAVNNEIELTIVGPEVPLVNGIVDKFREKGLKIFGPNMEAAKLEGSKAYAKEFMRKYGVKTAEYEVFDDVEGAIEYLNKCSYPIVIKADGLAAGKGVSICSDFETAKKTLDDYMINDVFSGAGKRIVIEEFLEGIEASILSITDGNTILPFISCMDHKKIFDGNEGPNTGGMGSIAPNPYCTEEILEEFEKAIMMPTLNGIKDENIQFTGIIFFGIMLTKNGVYLLEYNIRLGDPETQAVLPLMDNDLIDLINNALNGNLKEYKLNWKNKYSCCVIAASKGYPNKYEKGYEIINYNDIEEQLFIAGANYIDDKLVTTGGRVLAVNAVGDSLDEAINKAYYDISKVEFEGIYYRKDIGTSYDVM